MTKKYMARVLAELVKKKQFTLPIDSENFKESEELYELLRKQGLARRTKDRIDGVDYYIYKSTTKAEQLLSKIGYRK